MDEWVAQVIAVFPSVEKSLVLRDLSLTRDPHSTINRILDGQLIPTGQCDFRNDVATIDLSSPPREVDDTRACQGASDCNVLPRKGWGSLRPPTARDMAIRRGPKSLLQPPPLEHLVILDFEWTADKRQAMLPVSEITQFPSVLLKLDGHNSVIVDEFNSYVRPTLNPTLTPFSVSLTGITQETVDRSPTLAEVLPKYIDWLKSHALVTDMVGNKNGRWAICTWSDADVGTQLVRELRYKQLAMPVFFNHWIDLKTLYKRHFKREPSGGLQRCVEHLGLEFCGRAHDGLVDSRNTAAIALHMARGSMVHGSFVFRRFTRGLDSNGDPFGSKTSSRKRRPESHEADRAAGSGAVPQQVSKQQIA